MTTSSSEDHITYTYGLGANSFIIKPVTFASLVEVMRTIEKYWLEIVELPLKAMGGRHGEQSNQSPTN